MTSAQQDRDPRTLIGRWELAGFSEVDAGDRSGSFQWIFNDPSVYDSAALGTASGETLTFEESGDDVRFSMRGGARVPWMSAEKEQGVLEDAIEDQDGRVRGFLKNRYRLERLVNDKWVSAYSDSDLDMNNLVFMDGQDLVLMVTAIADELYVTKYFYRFAHL